MNILRCAVLFVIVPILINLPEDFKGQINCITKKLKLGLFLLTE